MPGARRALRPPPSTWSSSTGHSPTSWPCRHQLRGTSGTTIALPETATPGTYRSTARTWTADHHPGDLRVDGQSVRKVAVDVTRADTRIHVVDPT